MEGKAKWRREPIGLDDGEWRVLNDHSCVAESGRTVLFSVDRFKREIIESDNCFLCGLPESEGNPFNKEHVIPDWVVTRFALHRREARLPNESLADSYDKYKIPCCEHCNSLLGTHLEQNVRNWTSGGYRALIDHVEADGGNALPVLFTWLSLVYFKVHYRDRKYPEHRDPRMGGGYVGDRYDWATFHHVYCVARSVLTGAEIAPAVFGTLMILPVDTDAGAEPYDYIDDSLHKVVYMRLGDLAFLAVLNDGKQIQPYLQRILEEAQPPYSLRVVLGTLAQAMFHNRYLISRPTYESRYDPSTRAHFIAAKTTGAVEFARPDYTFLGDMNIQLLRRTVDVTDAEIVTIRAMCSNLAATMDR